MIERIFGESNIEYERIPQSDELKRWVGKFMTRICQSWKLTRAVLFTMLFQEALAIALTLIFNFDFHNGLSILVFLYWNIFFLTMYMCFQMICRFIDGFAENQSYYLIKDNVEQIEMAKEMKLNFGTKTPIFVCKPKRESENSDHLAVIFLEGEGQNNAVIVLPEALILAPLRRIKFFGIDHLQR